MVMIPESAQKRVGDMPTGEPVPEGIYHLRCDKATLKEVKSGKNKGEPMVELMWTIFGPEDAEEFHGRKVFENPMLTGEGAFKMRQLLTAAGFDEDFILTDTDELMKIEIVGVVGIEKERAELDENNKPTGKIFEARNKIQKYRSMNEA
jgi:hypothetical protein